MQLKYIYALCTVSKIKMVSNLPVISNHSKYREMTRSMHAKFHVNTPSGHSTVLRVLSRNFEYIREISSDHSMLLGICSRNIEWPLNVTRNLIAKYRVTTQCYSGVCSYNIE